MAAHVLLVDDDPLFREIAGEYLTSVGIRVTAAEDGAKALEALSAWRFDLIITDMVMPNLDGLELLGALKEVAPETPVIAVSAGYSGSDPGLVLRAALAAGARTVLQKPITQPALLKAVAEALAGIG
jgi:CheY-like chemotaxis protein